jgi:hypothetical protein
VAFVKFLKRQNSGAITVRRNGTLGLSAGLIREHKLENFRFCNLYYDETTGQIGLQFLPAYQAGCAKIIANGRQYFLHARRFISSNKIEAGAYSASLDLALGFFVCSRS